METLSQSGFTPRPPIGLRPWTNVQRLLKEHNISQRWIEETSGVPVSSVNRALSLRFCGRTSYELVIKTRRAAEQLLAVQGADFNPETLWAEYDAPLLEETV